MAVVSRKVTSFVSRHGAKALDRLVDEAEAKTQGPNALSIIVNAGMHEIPRRYLRGELFEFTRGSAPVEGKKFERTLESALMALGKKLQSREWTEIYVIPTGHPVFNIHVALLVFRITRIEPVLVGYFGEHGYRRIYIPHRPIFDKMTKAKAKPKSMK